MEVGVAEGDPQPDGGTAVVDVETSRPMRSGSARPASRSASSSSSTARCASWTCSTRTGTGSARPGARKLSFEPALAAAWPVLERATPAQRERILGHVAAALDEDAGLPELTQLLSWLRVHTLRLEPAPEDDEDAAERLIRSIA